MTASGRPAAIEGALSITVISGDGTFLQDPAEPLVFRVVSGDAVADTVYDVAGDADLGAGVVTIHDTVTLTVTSAQAASFGFTQGPVELK
jgi:hypothetical protein